MNFQTYLEMEWIKCRRSHLFWLLLIAPILVVFSGVSHISFYLTPAYANAWAAMFIQSALLYAYYLLPFTMIVISVMIAGRETVHGGLRKMKSLPVNMAAISLAKFCILVFYLAAEILLFVLFFMIAGTLAVKTAGIRETLPALYLLNWGWQLFITMLPCLTFIWMITVLVKKMIFSIGLNLLLVIPGVLAAATPFWIFYPYCYSGFLVSCALHDFSAGAAESAPFPWLLFLLVGAAAGSLALVLACHFYGAQEE